MTKIKLFHFNDLSRKNIIDLAALYNHLKMEKGKMNIIHIIIPLKRGFSEKGKGIYIL